MASPQLPPLRLQMCFAKNATVGGNSRKPWHASTTIGRSIVYLPESQLPCISGCLNQVASNFSAKWMTLSRRPCSTDGKQTLVAGCIPTEFGDLRALTELTVGGNRLTGKHVHSERHGTMGVRREGCKSTLSFLWEYSEGGVTTNCRPFWTTMMKSNHTTICSSVFFSKQSHPSTSIRRRTLSKCVQTHAFKMPESW